MNAEAPARQARLIPFLESLGVFVGLNAGVLGLASLHLIQALQVHDSAVTLGVSCRVFVILFGLTMATYNVDRWRDRKTDADANAQNLGRSSAWTQLLLPVGLLAVGIPLLLALLGSLPIYQSSTTVSTVGLVTSLFLAGLFYTVPVPGRPAFRFKQFPYLKSVYVSAVWGLALLIPATMTGLAPEPVFAFAGYIFLRMIPACNIGDVRDETADRGSGLLTLPTALGVKCTAGIMHGVTGLAVLWLVLSVALGWLVPAALILGANCILASVLWVLLPTKKISAESALAITFCELLAIWPLVVVASSLKLFSF